MPHLRVLPMSLFLLSLIAPSLTHAREYCQSLSAGLDRIVSATNSKVNVGLVVKSVKTGQTYYSKNADRYFTPASVQKLFTVASALITLKPNFQFFTRLLSNGTLRGDVLYGNLIIQFTGDPTLTKQQLNNLIKKLSDVGIRKIVGNIIIDNSAYNHVPYPAGWAWDDLSFDYAAPLDSIIVDRNRFGLTLIPSKQLGRHPQLIPHLPAGAATFYNEAITARRPCPLKILSNEKNQYLIKGCLSRSTKKIGQSLAIRNVEMYAKSLVRALMLKNHIMITGKILTQKKPPNATLLAEHASPPLRQLLVHLLKKSDNIYADTLVKKMGQHHSNGPGSWENGLQAMLPILQKYAGINTGKLHLMDGAGLSRYNLITPHHLSLLLHYIAHNPMLRDTLIPALPIAGVDGTLAYRMSTLARGKVLRAKTGSMDGVATLAGYVKTKHYGSLSFVIMLNNVPKNRYPYICLENRIAEFLAKAPPPCR